MSEKQTIVLIPGAWHQASVWDPVTRLLQEKDYPVEKLTLLSAGGTPSTTVADDVAYIRQTQLDDLIAQGKEVVVTGAFPDRAAKGEKGGVVALVYVAAWLLPKDRSLDSMIPGGIAPALSIDGDKGYISNPTERFYQDLPEETASSLVSALSYHAVPSFPTPLTYEAYRDVPSTYLLCENDNAIPIVAQKAMVAYPGDGVIRLRTCGSGHSPTMSMPRTVADVVHEASMAGLDRGQ